MCVKKVAAATIAGGIAVFIWGMISWMALPWHNVTLHPIKNEASVSKTLSANIDKSGIYLMPYTNDFSGKAKEEFDKKYESGPLAFVAFSKEGGDPTMKFQMIIGLLLHLAGALIISMLLCGTKSLSYAHKVLFVGGTGLLVGLLGNVPNYIWWHFPMDFTLVNIADSVIGWALAGLVMAKIIKD